MEDRPLADLFPPATRERWLGLVDGVLKGAEFEKRLVSKTADGIRIEPLYDAAAPVAQPVRAPAPGGSPSGSTTRTAPRRAPSPSPISRAAPTP